MSNQTIPICTLCGDSVGAAYVWDAGPVCLGCHAKRAPPERTALTLREQLTVAALSGLLARDLGRYDEAPEMAVKVADWTIEELAKETK